MERGSFMLFGFGSVFFLLRMMSKDDWGTWALFVTVSSTIEVARNGLIQNALVKHLASSEKEEHGVITTASFALNIILTAFSILLLLGLSGWLSALWSAPALGDMLKIYSLTTVMLIFLSQLTFIQQANFDFRGNFWGNFVRQGSWFTFVVTCFFTNKEITLISLSWFQVFAAALGGFVSYFFGKKYLVFSGVLNWEWVRKLFHFGKFTLGTNMSTMLYKFVGTWMIGWLTKSPASAGVFDLANRISNLLEVPTATMANIVFPQSAKRAATEGKSAVKYLYEKSVGIVIALIIPAVVLIWVFAEQGVLIVAGNDYAETVPVLKIALLIGIFIPFSRQFGTVLDSMGKPKTNLYFVVFSTLLNIALNFILIKQYGVMGAAYGALITAVVRLFVNQVILRKILDVRFVAPFHYAKDFYAQCFNFGMSKIRKITGQQRSAL